jgi:hypothetical protein
LFNSLEFSTRGRGRGRGRGGRQFNSGRNTFPKPPSQEPKEGQVVIPESGNTGSSWDAPAVEKPVIPNASDAVISSSSGFGKGWGNFEKAPKPSGSEKVAVSGGGWGESFVEEPKKISTPVVPAAQPAPAPPALKKGTWAQIAK